MSAHHPAPTAHAHPTAHAEARGPFPVKLVVGAALAVAAGALALTAAAPRATFETPGTGEWHLRALRGDHPLVAEALGGDGSGWDVQCDEVVVPDAGTLTVEVLDRGREVGRAEVRVGGPGRGVAGFVRRLVRSPEGPSRIELKPIAVLKSGGVKAAPASATVLDVAQSSGWSGRSLSFSGDYPCLRAGERTAVWVSANDPGLRLGVKGSFMLTGSPDAPVIVLDGAQVPFAEYSNPVLVTWITWAPG